MYGWGGGGVMEGAWRSARGAATASLDEFYFPVCTVLNADNRRSYKIVCLQFREIYPLKRMLVLI